MSSFVPTGQQTDVFRWAEQADDLHLQVLAAPGVGKTTTAFEVACIMAKRPGRPVAVFAFDRETMHGWVQRLADRFNIPGDLDEQRSRLRSFGFRVQTLDGLAMSMCSRSRTAYIDGKPARNPWLGYFGGDRDPDFHLVRVKHWTKEHTPQDPVKLRPKVVELVVAVMQTAPYCQSAREVMGVLVARRMGLSDAWLDSGFSDRWLADRAWAVFEQCMKPDENMDSEYARLSFAEMQCIALRFQLYRQRRPFARIIVDECQDASYSQLRLVWLCRARRHGSVCLVGDPRQAIYTWRGAAPHLFRDFPSQVNLRRYGRGELAEIQDALRALLTPLETAEMVSLDKDPARSLRAMHGVIREVQRRVGAPVTGDICQAVLAACARARPQCGRFAREGVRVAMISLPLTVTFRCSRSVVQYARRWMPEYQAMDGAVTGSTGDDTFLGMVSTAGPDSFIISRTRAGAAHAAFEILAAGTPVALGGSKEDQNEVGKVIAYAARRCDTIARFKISINQWATRQVADTDDPDRMEAVRDMAALIHRFADHCESPSQAEALVDNLFRKPPADERRQLVYVSTVHGVKGLEARDVWILGYTFPGDDRPPADPYNLNETERLWFVAATRAKNNLRVVRKDPTKANR